MTSKKQHRYLSREGILALALIATALIGVALFTLPHLAMLWMYALVVLWVGVGATPGVIQSSSDTKPGGKEQPLNNPAGFIEPPETVIDRMFHL